MIGRYSPIVPAAACEIRSMKKSNQASSRENSTHAERPFKIAAVVRDIPTTDPMTPAGSRAGGRRSVMKTKLRDCQPIAKA